MFNARHKINLQLLRADGWVAAKKFAIQGMTMTENYDAVYQASKTDPGAFWAEAAKLVSWSKEPTTILDDSKPPFLKWFPDGETNGH